VLVGSDGSFGIRFPREAGTLAKSNDAGESGGRELSGSQYD